jgi:dTDP-4-dehydrorhamnose 3,5-epimerase
MEIKATGINGLVEIFPKIFHDERGFFFESFHEKKLKDAGINATFVQDNQSFSQKGVLRGLHLQNPPYAQGKLVRVITGKALDVAVDLRKDSPTFGKSYKVILDSQKNNMLYIPEGFGHGFVALEDTIFFYKCTNYYNKASESGIIWNDPDLNIDWGISQPNVSEKDQELLSFEEFKKTL